MTNLVSKSRLEREIRARKEAEKILEEKSLELYYISQKLKETNQVLELLVNEKETQLRGIFQNINDAYVLIDLEGNILKMNEVSENFLGVSISDKEKNLLKFIHVDDYDYAKSSFNNLIENGVLTDFTSRIVNKKGKVNWVNINATVVYSQENKPIAAQGIIRDVTIQRNKQQLIDLVNNSAKSILGKNEISEIAWEISKNIANYLSVDDCIIYLVNHENQSLEQIAAFGEKEENKVIKNKLVLNIGEGIVGRVAKTGISEIIKDTNKDSDYIVDDKIRRSEITVPILYDDNVIGVIDAEHENANYFTKEHLATIENIANLVSLQLQSAINHRELKVIEAKNNDLLQELSRSNEELKEYAHIVSHDLKSPLRSIAALCDWIKNDNIESFDENSLENFKLIEDTLEKMDKLISDVLQYSKIDAISSDNEYVDLNILINEIIKFLYIPNHIEINVKTKLPLVIGEKVKFQQLFQNLISNAIKFNDKEKGEITIDCVDENSFYKFIIKDNGIGIDKKHHEKIFKIFQSLQVAKDSTGIGLSIVKKIVSTYKGEIWVESELNEGTTFYFTIKK